MDAQRKAMTKRLPRGTTTTNLLRVYHYVDEKPNTTRTRMARDLNLHDRAVRSAVDTLEELGIIESKKPYYARGVTYAVKS